MEKIKSKQKKITMGLMLIYVVVLVWIILFKMQFSLQYLRRT